MSEISNFLTSRARAGLLPWSDQEACAQKFHVNLARVEERALELGLLPARYQRNQKTLSTAHQLRLFQSRVAIIGCGGLGGYIVEELSRLGVGHLVVVDPDVFEEHNLNRQLFSSTKTLGLPKVEAAEKRISQINPAVTVTTSKVAFNSSNAGQILQGAQVAVDALDSIKTRLQLSGACKQLEIPLIHGAISGWYGQVAVQYPGEDVLEKIYGGATADKGIEVQMGNPAFTPAVIASLQVAEVCKTILGLGPCRSSLFHVNLLEMEWTELKL